MISSLRAVSSATSPTSRCVNSCFSSCEKRHADQNRYALTSHVADRAVKEPWISLRPCSFSFSRASCCCFSSNFSEHMIRIPQIFFANNHQVLISSSLTALAPSPPCRLFWSRPFSLEAISKNRCQAIVATDKNHHFSPFLRSKTQRSETKKRGAELLRKKKSYYARKNTAVWSKIQTQNPDSNSPISTKKPNDPILVCPGRRPLQKRPNTSEPPHERKCLNRFRLGSLLTKRAAEALFLDLPKRRWS